MTGAPARTPAALARKALLACTGLLVGAIAGVVIAACAGWVQFAC